MSFQDAALSTHFFWVKFLAATTHGSFWTVVLEKTLESSLDCKKIKPVNPKGDQSWIFIGRTDAKAETPLFWPKNWLIGKDSDVWKDWEQEEKGMTEGEMVRWHHQLNGHEFEQASRVGDGQGSLAYCSLWGCKESDMTEELNWTEPLMGSTVLILLFFLATTWIPLGPFLIPRTMRTPLKGMLPSVTPKWFPSPVCTLMSLPIFLFEKENWLYDVI